MVGDRHGLHPRLHRMLSQLVEMASTVQKTELRVEMKMNKLGGGHGGWEFSRAELPLSSLQGGRREASEGGMSCIVKRTRTRP